MGWSVGFDPNWKRDIGYGVPSVCDHPECNEEIDRGLGYVCGGQPYGGEHGCGLFFCQKHRGYCDDGAVCEHGGFEPSPDTKAWVRHKLTDESWQQWRDENPEQVAKLTPAAPIQPK